MNILTDATDGLPEDELRALIEELRDVIETSKVQWNKLAAILQADGDNVDLVFAAARTAMAGIGGDQAQTDIDAARTAFPAFSALHEHIDQACLYELERFNRHCDELAAMSLEQFIAFKEEANRGVFKTPTQWVKVEPNDTLGPIGRLVRRLMFWS